jgi:hypothetical protein
MKEEAAHIIANIQILTDELIKHATHADEFSTVSDLQIDLHKVRQAFETQLENGKEES